MKGKVVIFSAPSGSGKTTIVRHLLHTVTGLGFSISATTRPRRGEEIDGKDYYFLTKDEFMERIKRNDFVEWEEVYEGVFYGTLRAELERNWKFGRTVLFDVDVKGGLSIKEILKEDALAVFVKVTDMDTLRSRLGKRATDTIDSINSRLEKAKSEMDFEKYFDVVLLNDNLPEALTKAEQVVSTFISGKSAQ